MAEEQGSDAALSARIEKLEEVVRQNEVLRRQTRIWSLLGVLVVLTLLLVFVGRIYTHFQSNYYEEIKNNPQEFVQEFYQASGVDATLKEEGKAALVQIQNEVTKKFTATFLEELTKAMPEIEKNAMHMGEGLADHAKDHLEKKVTEALAGSLEKSLEDIKKEFPELEEKDLNKYVDMGKEQFIEKLHDAVEARVAKVTAHMDGLKAAATKVRNSKGSDQLSKANQGQVAELLIDAVVDVLVYELKPELGNAPAE